MRYRIAILAVALVAGGILSSGESQALDVTSPTQISSPSAVVNAETVYLAAGNRSITELWTQAPFPARGLYASRSTNDGDDWSEPVRISSEGTDASFINGYVVQDTFYVAWSQYNPQTASTGAMFTKSVDSGLTWTDPLELSDSGNDIAVVGAASVFAVYDDGGFGTGNIQIRKSTDFGDTFEPEVTIATVVYDTVAAVHDSDLFVGYIGPDNAGAWRFPEGDLTQGIHTPFDIQALGQRIDIGPNGPVMTFTGDTGDGLGIYHTTFHSAAWKQLTEIYRPLDPALALSIPDIDFSGTRTVFTWTEIVQGAPASVLLASYVRANDDVDGVLHFTDPDEQYFDPSVRVDGERAYAAITSAPADGEAGSEAIEIWGFNPEAPLPSNVDDLPYAGTTSGAVPDLHLCPPPVQRAGGIAQDFIDVCMTFIEFANNFAEATLFFARGSVQGDADCSPDASVTAVDALVILREVAGLQTPPCSHSKDVNCDGAVNAVDALVIQRAVAALSNAIREGCSAIGWRTELFH